MKHDDSVWSEGDSVASRPSQSQFGSVASGGSVASRGSADSAGNGSGTATAGTGTRASGSRARTRGTAGLLDHAGADMQCCTFRLGGQLFGLSVDTVGEVFTIERLVNVPLAPNGVLGLTNLRGAALAVVDLGTVLGLEIRREQALTGTGPALVLQVGGMRLAASIDYVESVFPVHSEDIRESDAIGEHPAIGGFLTVGNDEVVSILDAEELAERLRALRLRGEGDGHGKADLEEL